MIALIPARLGSKRFPGKNRAKLNGKSLLEIANLSAMGSGVIQDVYISTDDDVLIHQAKDLGIIAPFKRAPELARDETSSWEVVRDFISKTGYDGDLCLLQLTSPLREPGDILHLYSVYKNHGAHRGLTVRISNEGSSPQKNWLCDCNGIISNSRHCQTSHLIVPNGSVYIVNSTRLSLNPFTPLTGCSATVMPAERSVDIDYEYELDEISN